MCVACAAGRGWQDAIRICLVASALAGSLDSRVLPRGWAPHAGAALLPAGRLHDAPALDAGTGPGACQSCGHCSGRHVDQAPGESRSLHGHHR